MTDATSKQPFFGPVRTTVLLLVCAALGFVIFGPTFDRTNDELPNWLHRALVSCLLGLTLPGVVLAWPKTARPRSINWGRVAWFMLSLGTWLNLPPVLLEKWATANDPTRLNMQIAQICSLMVTPTAAFLLLVALVLAGKGNQLLRPLVPPDRPEKIGQVLLVSFALLGGWDWLHHLSIAVTRSTQIGAWLP